MLSMTFDTYQLIKELQQSGFNEIQAEGLSTAFKEIQSAQLENLATKSDIRELRSELKADLKENKADLKRLESELKADLQKLESELKADLKEVKSDLKRFDSELKSDLKLIKWVLALIVVVILLPTLKELFT